MHVIDRSKSRGFSARLQHGRELAGEDRVVAALSNLLDDSYYLIRHFVLPGERFQLDMVLAGPAGVWAMEILHYVGLVHTDSGWMHWDYREQGLLPVPPNVAGQARNRFARLADHLAEHGLRGLDIQEAFVLSTPNAPHDFALPDAPVTFIDELPQWLEAARSVIRPAAPVPVAQIAQLLGDLKPAVEAEAKPSQPRAGLRLSSAQRWIIVGLIVGILLVALTFVAAVLYYANL